MSRKTKFNIKQQKQRESNNNNRTHALFSFGEDALLHHPIAPLPATKPALYPCTSHILPRDYILKLLVGSSATVNNTRLEIAANSLHMWANSM